ncbi:MAG: hypothetical protein R2820_04215 [Cyclobacteriaceae bacterium]
MKPIDFKTLPYFSGTMTFLGVLLLFSGLWMMSMNILVGLVLVLLSVVILTTHYRVSIDLDNKSFHDYLWILGIRRGERGQFDNLEYLFIKKNKISQTMRLKVASTTVRKEVYDGYLRFSVSHKIHLLTMDDKSKLMNRLKVIAQQLNSRVIDYSDGEGKEV